MAILAWAGDSLIFHLDNEGRLSLVSTPNPRLGSGKVIPGLAVRSALPGSMFLLLSDGTWGGIGGMAGLHRALAQIRQVHRQQVMLQFLLRKAHPVP